MSDIGRCCSLCLQILLQYWQDQKPSSVNSSVLLITIYISLSQNKSLLLLPEKNICYLLPLDKDMSPPRKLLTDLDKAEVRTCNVWDLLLIDCWKRFSVLKSRAYEKQPPYPTHDHKGCGNVIRRFWRCLCLILQKSDKKITTTRIIEHKWRKSSEVTDRSVLSDELANFCANYPIYNVKKMEDTLTANRIQTGGERRIRTVKIEHMLLHLSQSFPGQRPCVLGQRWPKTQE